MLFMFSSFVDVFLFFFKQKTAYELRISDWSSDVCSSDLYGNKPPKARQSQWPSSSSPPSSRLMNFSKEWAYAYGRTGTATPACTIRSTRPKIGRASCRERVCQYV